MAKLIFNSEMSFCAMKMTFCRMTMTFCKTGFISSFPFLIPGMNPFSFPDFHFRVPGRQDSFHFHSGMSLFSFPDFHFLPENHFLTTRKSFSPNRFSLREWKWLFAPHPVILKRKWCSAGYLLGIHQKAPPSPLSGLLPGHCGCWKMTKCSHFPAPIPPRLSVLGTILAP